MPRYAKVYKGIPRNSKVCQGMLSVYRSQVFHTNMLISDVCSKTLQYCEACRVAHLLVCLLPTCLLPTYFFACLLIAHLLIAHLLVCFLPTFLLPTYLFACYPIVWCPLACLLVCLLPSCLLPTCLFACGEIGMRLICSAGTPYLCS